MLKQHQSGRTVRLTMELCIFAPFSSIAREREVREDRTAGEWRRAEPVAPPAGRFGNDRYADRGDRAPRGDREFGSRFNNSERPPDRTAVNSWRREEPLPASETRPGWEKPREREHRDTSWGGGQGFANRTPPGMFMFSLRTNGSLEMDFCLRFFVCAKLTFLIQSFH